MHFTCDKNDLNYAITLALKAVPAKTTAPAQECILVEADDTIKLTGNDTEMGIEAELSGMVMEPGTVMLNAKLFSDIVKKLPNHDAVAITSSGSTVEISCGKSKFQIGSRDGDDFLRLPEVTGKPVSFDVDTVDFREMIQKIIFCTTQNGANRMMEGVQLSAKDNVLTAVALDGYRIGIRRLPVNSAEFSVVVPGKTLSSIAKIMSGGSAKITITKNHIQFDIAGAKVISRLIDGEFFNVKNVMSANYTIMVTVDRKEITDSFGRTTVVMSSTERKPVVVDVKDDIMTINAKSTIGTVHEELECVDHQGGDIHIGFNPHYMMDALNAIDSSEVTIRMINPKSPCDISGEGFTYIVLPVNINS